MRGLLLSEERRERQRRRGSIRCSLGENLLINSKQAELGYAKDYSFYSARTISLLVRSSANH